MDLTEADLRSARLQGVHTLGPLSSILQEEATQAPPLPHCLCPRKCP